MDPPMDFPRSLVDVAEPSRDGLLRERAYIELKKLIVSGELGKTPFLSTRNLAKHLGMSLTPVRSAIERLETEGLLSIGPQRGVVVNELTTSEIVDHFEIRQALETLVMRKLAGRLHADQAQELRSNVAAHQASLTAGDIEQYIMLDGSFHLLLAEFSGNADIERVLRQLRDRIFRIVLRVIEHVPDRMCASIDEHRQIVDLLTDGDATRAADVMKQHLRGGLKAIVPGYQPQDFGL
jgi:DNA-binding GntR family transcriptional regulator